jgi:probable HAF family extracellular repeat protein
MKHSIGTALLVIALTGFATLAEAQTVSWPPPHYAVTNLGTLGGSESNGYGGVTNRDNVTNGGWASGDSFLRGDQTEHAFVWNGVMTDLGTVGGPNSSTPWPQKNTYGLIVGQAQGSQIDPLKENWGVAYGCNTRSGICDGYKHLQFGFLWQNGVMTALPTLGGNNSTATSDNNNNPGYVVGMAETATVDPTCARPQRLDYRAVVYEPHVLPNNTVYYQPHELPMPKSTSDTISVAFGINDNRDVVGLSGTCGTPDTSALGVHALLWPNGLWGVAPSVLPGLGGVMNNGAFVINDSGWIVGISDPPGDQTTHAVLWQKNLQNGEYAAIDLGTLPGDVFSVANDINASGHVVGVSCDANSNCRAFLWERGVGMVDLNSLVGSSLYLTFGGGINDSDEIAGSAFDPSTGDTTAFLASPAPAAQIAGDSARKITLPENVRTSLQRRLHLRPLGGPRTAQQ